MEQSVWPNKHFNKLIVMAHLDYVCATFMFQV